MQSIVAFFALALALSHISHASAIAIRQEALTVADTVQFIAKTIGSNPSPSALPDINNWHFVPVHAGADINIATLVSPTAISFNLSAPGYFRNGTDVPHGDGGYVTAGFLSGGTIPYSLILSLGQDPNTSNPGARIGNIEFNQGLGTSGLDIPAGQLITSNYVTDSFWACPNVPIEGGTAVVVEVSNRYAEAPKGCWEIELYAQCAGPISEANREGFPAFLQGSCYANASSAIVS